LQGCPDLRGEIESQGTPHRRPHAEIISSSGGGGGGPARVSGEEAVE
jgi:hypothetical protein